jgi:hypothetical protein
MSNRANNVISFPRAINPKLPVLEDIQHNLDMMKHYHIQETIFNMMPIMFNQLDIAGFGLEEDEKEDVRYGAFIVEALRSLMLEHYGIHHPFQTLAKNVFEKELTDEGAFKIVEEIQYLDLREPEPETE